MHLTDDQLNEYLDNETSEHAQIEAHLYSCDECAARLFALQTLFAEIESLPEIALSSNIADRFNPTPSLPAKLPRWLTLTLTLQTVAALIALVMTAPFISNLLPAIEIPSLPSLLLQLQRQWITWLDLFSSFQLPTLPQLPALEISSLMLTLMLVGVSLLWVFGNGLLLRKNLSRGRRPSAPTS